MQITFVFLGENEKGILMGWGKATTSLRQKAVFPYWGTRETSHCVLAGEGCALFNITEG